MYLVTVVCILCRDVGETSSDRYDLVWSVPIKSVDILDPTLPSVYKAPIASNRLAQSKAGV